MGYMTAMGLCLTCGRVFSFNPERVPSLRWPPPDGPREPICEDCMRAVNAERERIGMPRLPVHPDAYEPEEVG